MTADPQPPARLRVLLDAADDAAVTAGLLARHDPPGGCVVVHPTPAAYGRLSLGHDLLAALGRPVDELRADRIGGVSTSWCAAAAWLAADRIEHLVVLRAHRLPTYCCVALIELARTTGVALLLVCHTPVIPQRLRTRVHGVVSRVFTDLADAVRELDQARARPAQDRPPRRRYADLPGRLPTGQVLHYRADVYRQHARETFTRVDDLYGRGLDAACQWLRQRPCPSPRHTVTADEQLQRFLTDLVHASPTVRHTLALLRGVQAGFLLHGSWLAIPALGGELCGPGLTSTPVTFDVAERIRTGVAHPVLAAGVALALFTGINLLSLRSLRLDAIPPPSQVLRLPFHISDVRKPTRAKLGTGVPHQATVVLHIPVAARPLIRAARTFLRSSPDPHQRVFASFSPMHEHIADAAARCGLRLPRKPAGLVGAWPLRVRWTGLDEAVHTDRPDPAGAGRSCLTARPAATDPAGARGEPPGRITIHPDIPFALRLTDRPAPLNPA